MFDILKDIQIRDIGEYERGQSLNSEMYVTKSETADSTLILIFDQ